MQAMSRRYVGQRRTMLRSRSEQNGEKSNKLGFKAKLFRQTIICVIAGGICIGIKGLDAPQAQIISNTIKTTLEYSVNYGAIWETVKETYSKVIDTTFNQVQKQTKIDEIQ